MQMNRYYTVGIVEDEVIERQALRMIMEEKRPVLQVVFEAEDGNSALKMARQYQPDISDCRYSNSRLYRSGIVSGTASGRIFGVDYYQYIVFVISVCVSGNQAQCTGLSAETDRGDTDTFRAGPMHFDT